jgi:predicted Zn-dependent protease
MKLKQALLTVTIAWLLPIFGCKPATDSSKETQSPVRAEVRPSATVATTDRVGAVHDYASLLKDIDRRIDGLQKRADKSAGDWLTRQHLAALLLERAGLTNRMSDFARVERVLGEAFAAAPDGSGPLLIAARFNFSIHRLDRAERILDKMDRQAGQKKDTALQAYMLRAQIAAQRGQYDRAFEDLSAVATAMPAAARADLALYHAKVGEADEAQNLLEEALAATSARDPRKRAWTLLQLGLVALDNGRFEDALLRLQEADAELPGWWLVEEHLAELYNTLGVHAKAITIYEKLVAREGLAQHMDPLVALYEHTGRTQEAQALKTRAGALWEADLAQFPEAAMGHGLSHYLSYGTPERALELAEANYRARPGGEAQVSLGRAYLKAGRPGDALEITRLALAGPYRSAALYDVASRANAALGNRNAADDQKKFSLAMNPLYEGQHSH